VLQRVEAEAGQLHRLGVTAHAEDAAHQDTALSSPAAAVAATDDGWAISSGIAS
jgi:hypothetical protein